MATKQKSVPASKTVRVARAPKAQAPAQIVLQSVAVANGIAVAAVAVKPAQVYRTKAPHNQAWFSAIVAQIGANTGGPQGAHPATAAVAPMLVTKENPAGVPSHFFGYCLRRGYLVKAA